MIKWRPSIDREVIIRLQQAMKNHPSVFDASQCYYYITDRDIATSLHKEELNVTKDDVKAALSGFGLSLDKGVYEINLHGLHTSGYFAPESILLQAGVEIPPWSHADFFRAESKRPGRPKSR